MTGSDSPPGRRDAEIERKDKRPIGGGMLMCCGREKGQCRLVLSVKKHLDPVALPAGFHRPQAVLTKQTSLL